MENNPGALFQRENPHVVNGTVVLRQQPVCPAFPAGYIAPWDLPSPCPDPERKDMAKVFDAWIVGQHQLPLDVPRRVVGSAVVVHDRDTGEWTGMSLDQFEDEFEWLPEQPEPLIAIGDLGVI
jgi:hypothetical protein